LKLKIFFAFQTTFLPFCPDEGVFAPGPGKGERRWGGENTTQLSGSSCSPEQMEGWFQNTRKGRETARFLECNLLHQWDVDAGSQVAIRQSPSVL